MQVTLYQALKAINVEDEQAAKLVDKLEEHIAVKISEANRGLEARFSALESEMKSTKWVIGFIGTLLAVIGLAPAITKLF